MGSWRCEDPRFEALANALAAFDLSPEVTRSIATLVDHHGSPPKMWKVEDRPSLHQVAVRFHKLAVGRTEIFGGNLGWDPAWNMMIGLFADQEIDRPATVSDACMLSGASYSTGLRYIQALKEGGHLTSHDDPRDHRRVWVRMTPLCRDRMEHAIRQACFSGPNGTQFTPQLIAAGAEAAPER